MVEKGVTEDIDLVSCNPLDETTGLRSLNPLSKIPTLMLEDGAALYDSPVIAEYLDSLSKENPLIPSQGAARWRVLRHQALGDGIMDAAVATVLERRRPENEQSPSWISRWRQAITQAVGMVEQERAMFEEPFQLGQITLACALAYLDFRLPEIDWRRGHEATAEWFSEISERVSMTSTRPPK
tara:strand:- start:7191 stop:7739 length:549 start_codon:yes stop_codon:yes gene_type:complete